MIVFCSALSSCILFSPAKDFGGVMIAFVSHGYISEAAKIWFGIFCGVASVAATTVLGFNSWDKILSAPEKTFTALLKRVLAYIGGVTTAAPLMVDTFKVNQGSMPLAFNLLATILPGLFMSGVYGNAIEFLYDFIRGKHSDGAVSSRGERVKKLTAFGIGGVLGTISGIGCYWESLNALLPLVKSTTPIYILSALPVVCRAPLFIKSTYFLSYKAIGSIAKREVPSIPRLILLAGILLFSMFTIGGYSDITYNGMTQSSWYDASSIFRHGALPLILGVAMFCMLILNADALISAIDRAMKYFSESKYGCRAQKKTGIEIPVMSEVAPLLINDAVDDKAIELIKL